MTPAQALRAAEGIGDGQFAPGGQVGDLGFLAIGRERQRDFKLGQFRIAGEGDLDRARVRAGGGDGEVQTGVAARGQDQALQGQRLAGQVRRHVRGNPQPVMQAVVVHAEEVFDDGLHVLRG